MENQNYQTSIEIAAMPVEVFKRLTEVNNWWSKEFEGCSVQTGDEFIIHHRGTHYSKQRLTEVIPNEKIVWLVTESELKWLEDKRMDRHPNDLRADTAR